MSYNKRAIRITTLLILVLIAATGIAGSLMIRDAPPVGERPEPARVEYRFTNTAPRAMVTFLNDEGQQIVRETSDAGSYRFRGDPGRELLIEIKRLEAPGAVGCSITVDGKRVQEVTGNDDRAEARCQARLP